MPEFPLDRPVWHALNGPNARFALGNDVAMRFIPDIGPLAAAQDFGETALKALAALVPAQGALFTMEAAAHPPPPSIVIERREALQMVAVTWSKEPHDDRLLPLGASDATEMLALASLTEPGPFGLRTGELGQFWGVKAEGRLVAMAGERLRVPGFSEVSAVCTHPDHRGRGYARALMLRVMEQIAGRDETPFLTTYAHNSSAIRLYEAIGFHTRREMTISVLTRTG